MLDIDFSYQSRAHDIFNCIDWQANSVLGIPTYAYITRLP